ncbi:hypothetical protein [Paraburkholderia phenazinium]|uniref:hypothetical protein n=1 Tax=Paraburkholderia phenazinium TaxID=60549 RepID=UPI00158C426D|nr:hypothetical protein [Paraburkholderia phenazinium]
MDFRERTRIEFGAIEAHAARHLRVAPIVGTSCLLQLRDASAKADPLSPLRVLREGATLSLEVLRSLLPALGSVRWSFAMTGCSTTHELTTLSDGIRVSLLADDGSNSLTSFATEGLLRGIAARLVVHLDYGE